MLQVTRCCVWSQKSSGRAKMYSREVFPVEIYSQWLRILQEYFTDVFYFINMPDYEIVFNCLKIGRSYAILCTTTL